MLKQMGDARACFYIDEEGDYQGEYKEWWRHGVLMRHHHFVDNMLDGELKEWYANGVLERHCYCRRGEVHGEFRIWESSGIIGRQFFLKDGIDISSEVSDLVDDILYITPEEKILIKLKLGVRCL